MALPTAPTRERLNPDRVRLLMYGPPGSGKTTFAAGWYPDTNLHIDLEGGTRFLHGSGYRVRPKNFREFQATVVELMTTEHRFKTVTIDTMDALIRMADAEAARRGGKSAAGLVDFGKGITDRNAIVQEQMLKLASTDLGLIILSHAASQTVAVDGVEKEKFFPSIPKGNGKEPGLREFFMGVVDFLWAVRPAPHRTVVTADSEHYEVKSRVPLGGDIPLDPMAAHGKLSEACKEINLASEKKS